MRLAGEWPLAPADPSMRAASAILGAAASGIAVLLSIGFAGWRADPLRILDRSLIVYPAAGRLSALPGFRPSARRGPTNAEADSTRIKADLLDVLRETETAALHGGSRALRTLAAVQMSLGRQRDAIATLESASLNADPLLLSDLSAIYLTIGEPASDAKALDAAARAYDQDRRRPETRFNYARALQANGLGRAAVPVWREYLSIDADSGWAALARSAIKSGQEPGADTDVRGTGAAFADGLAMRYAIEEHLSAWAASSPKLGPRLNAACDLADRHARRYQDEFLRAMCRDARAGDRDRIGSGWRAFVDARQHIDALRFQDARSALAAARQAFDGASDAGVAAVGYHAAVLDYQTGAIETARARIAPLLRTYAAAGFAQLLGRAEWLLGIIDETQGSHSSALARFASAHERFVTLDEPENALTVLSLHAYALRRLGDYDGSWREHHAVLQQADRVQHSHRRQALFLTAGQAASALGLPHAAARLLDEYVRAAETLGAPPAKAEAYLNRLNIVGRDWPADRQIAELARVEETASRIDLPDRRSFVLARCALLRSRLAAPREAIDRAREAITHINGSGRVFLLPEALLLQSQGLMALGDAKEAEAGLRAGIAELEQQWAAIAQTPYRITFFDTGLILHETLIDLLLRSGRVDEAFAWADKSRMRALSRPDGSSEPGIDLRAFQRQLAPGSTALVYTKVLGTLRIWHVTRETSQVATSPASIAELARLTGEWRTAVSEAVIREDKLNDLAASLHDALVRPVGTVAPGRLIVVPDWPLHGISFSALRERATGRFLVQTSAVVIAPSPSAASGRYSSQTPQSVLTVAATRTDAAYDFLPNLPFAAREAADIGSLYPVRTVLTGTHATERQVLKSMNSAEVVHFATHAVAHPEDGALSYLLVSAESGSDGRLTSSELSKGSGRRPSLVVLAACGTAKGPVSRSEGPMSLSRALLASGVPRVVATQWDIDDQTTRDLMTGFHQGLRTGLDPIDALNRIQSRAAEHQPLSRWGAFAIYATRLEGTPSER